MKPPGRLKSFTPIIKAAIIIENDAKLEFDSKANPKAWSDYPARGSGKMEVIRPVIEPPWAFGVTVGVFDDMVKTAVLDDLFEIFGRVAGLGEAREYMGYGRFECTLTQV
jgi:hypothetical protein